VKKVTGETPPLTSATFPKKKKGIDVQKGTEVKTSFVNPAEM